jgi:methylmalonyl-CoA mutase
LKGDKGRKGLWFEPLRRNGRKDFLHELCVHRALAVQTTNFIMTNPFPPATYADWLAQVQKDLKDPNVYETLRWHTPEGFVAEPYYAETAAGEPTVPANRPGTVAGTRAGWLNGPSYRIGPDADLRAENVRLRDALANGADALVLNVPENVNLSLLLNGIKLSETPIFFDVEGDAGTLLTQLRQVAPYQIRGGINSTDGSSTHTADSPNFRTITVDGTVFHNAGATATQELAFTLAQLADVFDTLTDAGTLAAQLASKTVIRMAVGTSYFMEIAKLRALRLLLARFLNAYHIHHTSYIIHSITSPFYEAKATPYTNLLRATTEAMAAVIGGCDVLTVRPYDAVFGTETDFSQRIARNVSSLLRHESYLDKVADPAAGSYYIETLTQQLTEAAWALFLEIETMGGGAKATAAGYVQRELDAAYEAKVAAVQQGRVLVGVTKFRHDEGGCDGKGVDVRRLAREFE